MSLTVSSSLTQHLGDIPKVESSGINSLDVAETFLPNRAIS